MAKKSSKGKIRGVLGNFAAMVFAVCSLAFMAMPMFAQITTIGEGSGRSSLDSVFSCMGNVSDANDTYKGALVMFIIVAIIASLLILSTIIGLVGACMGNKKLNTSFISRVLAFVLIVVALVGMILTIVTASNGFSFSGSIIPASTKTVADAGAVLPLVFALLAIICTFIVPSKKKA